MEWIKTNWRQAIVLTLISVGLSTLGSLIVLSVTVRGQQVRGAASMEYVKEQDSALNDRLCLHDTKFTRLEDQMDLKVDKTDFQIMDKKIDNIYNLLIKMNNNK
jgi:hypothetical protein